MTTSSCANIVNLCIKQGSEYDHDFEYKESDLVTPVDITGWTFRSQFRSSVDAVGVIWDGSAGNFTITDGSAGLFRMNVPAADSEAFTIYEGVYDIEGVDGAAKPHRMAQGEFIINREVTR